MTRHGKNCTAGAVYTHHERRKDAAASGYGTQNVRLGREAFKDFDCCCLSLQPCRDPVVTPDGFLYERAAILEYLLHQKQALARRAKAYTRQRGARREELRRMGRAAARDALRRFEEAQAAPGSRALGAAAPRAEAEAGAQAKAAELPSFWIPAQTPEAPAPEAQAAGLEKPPRVVRCPMSGRPLRLSDLTPVRFTPADGAEGAGPGARGERYVCAVTRDSLSNSTRCAVLRPSGAVVTAQCVERLIRPDMVDPVSGARLSEEDIIPLQRGGTGFAAAGVQLEGQRVRPALQA